MSEESIISAVGLSRSYGRVMGLTDLTVDIPTGVIGLLGPNGAGKSTLLRLMTGMIKPSLGTIRVLGQDPLSSPDLFRSMGFVSEDDALYESMTPHEMVSFLGRASGLSKSDAREAAHESIQKVSLEAVTNRRMRGFSKGMRQRVRIAAALVHEPRLLLLDEPMTGLDPVARRDIVSLIERLAAEGVSVVFSSHILHEVEAVANHVVMLHRGLLLAHGSIQHIRDCLSDYAFTLEIRMDRPRELAARLAREAYVTSLVFEGEDGIRVGTSSSKQLVTALPTVLLEIGAPVREIACPGENLEALFGRLLK